MSERSTARDIIRLADASLNPLSGQKGALAPLRDGLTIALLNHNHELILPSALRSAMEAQTYLAEDGLSSEVVVVDDGSRDGSRVLLNQLEALYAPRVKVLATLRNIGTAFARNLVLLRGSFKHILFIDADNRLEPANVGIVYRAAVESGAALTFGFLFVHRFPDARTVVGSLNREPVRRSSLERPHMETTGVYDRRQLVEVGGYSDVLPASEDLEMFRSLLAWGRRLVYVPCVLGYYYEYALSRYQTYLAANPEADSQRDYLRRMFDQFGFRGSQPLRGELLMYHPELGYIDVSGRSSTF